MHKDYAKRTYKKRKPRKQKTKSKGWLWMFIGLLLGLFIAGLFYLHSQQPPIQKQAKSTVKKITVAHKSNTSPKTPQFDFYTLLPKMKIETQKTTPATSNAKQPKVHYMLQVAAVKRYADADRLKAQLTLLGFNVFIQKAKKGSTEWNRVCVGPYNSSTAANMDKKRLLQNHINSLLLKIQT